MTYTEFFQWTNLMKQHQPLLNFSFPFDDHKSYPDNLEQSCPLHSFGLDKKKSAAILLKTTSMKLIIQRTSNHNHLKKSVTSQNKGNNTTVHKFVSGGLRAYWHYTIIFFHISYSFHSIWQTYAQIYEWIVELLYRKGNGSNICTIHWSKLVNFRKKMNNTLSLFNTDYAQNTGY